MLRYVWMSLCVWMMACAPKVDGVMRRSVPMDTVEAEAVLTLAQGHTDTDSYFERTFSVVQKYLSQSFWAISYEKRTSHRKENTKSHQNLR